MFSRVDLRSRYHQVKVKNTDVFKITFEIRYEYYEFMVIPFGLTNILVIFMGLMNCIFKSFADQFDIIFIDDILIFSKSDQEYANHLRIVMELLRKNQLYANFSKGGYRSKALHF